MPAATESTAELLTPWPRRAAGEPLARFVRRWLATTVVRRRERCAGRFDERLYALDTNAPGRALTVTASGPIAIAGARPA